MIINFNENELDSIMVDVVDNFMNLVNHMKGLCVVKKVIQKTKKEKFMLRVIELIEENALNLVQNPYGNYAIQTSIEVNKYNFILIILNSPIQMIFVKE